MEKFSSILEVWPEGGSEQKFLAVALSSMNGDPTFPPERMMISPLPLGTWLMKSNRPDFGDFAEIDHPVSV
jgi:hypothetical protein